MAAVGSAALAGLIKLTTVRHGGHRSSQDGEQPIEVDDRVPESGWVRVEFPPDPDVARYRPLDGWRRILVRILLVITLVLFVVWMLNTQCDC